MFSRTAQAEMEEQGIFPPGHSTQDRVLSSAWQPSRIVENDPNKPPVPYAKQSPSIGLDQPANTASYTSANWKTAVDGSRRATLIIPSSYQKFSRNDFCSVAQFRNGVPSDPFVIPMKRRLTSRPNWPVAASRRCEIDTVEDLLKVPVIDPL